jgi:protein SCO1/2
LKSLQTVNRTGITGSALRFFLSLLICASAIGLACKPRRNPNEKRYDLKGKVVAVNKSERTATIAHEDIKGYMPAMTMPFKIKSDADLEMLKAADQVTGTLVVDDVESWVEITTIVEGPVTVLQTLDVPGEPRPGTEVPDFGLVNQDGKRIHLAQYRGQALALTFIYTRCPMPDQCTLMSSNFAAIDQELQKQPDVYARTHLLTVSFDPEYDSPKVLRSYGASHTGRYTDETFQHWEFAGGTADEVKGLAQFFGLRYFHDTESGQDQVIHSLRTVVIGPDGKLFKLYRGNEWKPAEIVSDLQSLAKK